VTSGTGSAVDPVERGRDAYDRRAWAESFDCLSQADATTSLGARDLELLATAAYMLGRDDDQVRLLERAEHAYADKGTFARAAYCAVWIGFNLADRNEFGPAGGWFARAERLVERAGGECAEAGYLRLPAMLQQAASGDLEGSHATALESAAIAEQFGDADLLALATMGQGRALLAQGRVAEGLAKLDEAMVGVTAGEVSPIPSGLVYCSLIIGCHLVYELRRAHEWTSALTRWCGEQPDMIVYTGECLVHRAEVMQHRGAWADALAEAERAGERFATRVAASRASAAQAWYRQGELHRLRGEAAGAENAYREASGLGLEPQPGLALLRLAQGDVGAASTSIRRALAETTDPGRRAGLLPAGVEILLAASELEEAREAARELEAIASGYPSEMLAATVAHARGAVQLAAGDAWAALVSLRQACLFWQQLEAPYDNARSRLLVGLACRELGDRDAGELEIDAARRAFEELGAAPDLAALGVQGPAGGLTARELEVLGLVAKGKSNRAIAADLVISEKTVARHLSNIFAKLGVSSRSAATAYAYENRLL
jgi:DNA-binding CsgD family transcriptional regulator